MKLIHKLSDSIDKVVLAIVVALIGMMVCVTVAQIVCRLARHSLLWSEEVCRFMLVWATFLGASCVYKAGAHISITLLQNMMPPAVNRAMRILVHVVCIVMFCAVVYYGAIYASKQFQLAPALRIRLSYMYYSIPIGFGLMILHAVDAIGQIMQEKRGRA